MSSNKTKKVYKAKVVDSTPEIFFVRTNKKLISNRHLTSVRNKQSIAESIEEIGANVSTKNKAILGSIAAASITVATFLLLVATSSNPVA